jgi:TolB-like protein/Tfp pilus assembly protein PilF
MTILVGIAIVGFPITIILAWLFDLTPDGVRRTTPGSATGILAIIVSMGLLTAGTAGFVWLIKPGDDAVPTPAIKEILANSIAVLPFRDLSPDGLSQPFADGIAEVLIHRLSTISDIKVIASDSSFAMREKAAEFQNIGRLLGVERVLLGSVQRSGNSLRISTQLIDSRTGESVWTQLFDRDAQDLFAIQDEIALTVAGKLDTEMSATAKARATRAITDDLDAFDLYTLAMHSAKNTPTDAGFAEAIELLEKSLEIDPDLALSWAALASAVYWTSTRGYIPRDEGISRSREYVARALQLDPELSEAYVYQIHLNGMIDDDFEAARRSFEKAIEYGPSNARAYLVFGRVLKRGGNFAEAISAWSKGIELNPVRPGLWLRTNLGGSYNRMGKVDLGMQQFAASIEEERGTALEGQALEHFGSAAGTLGLIVESVAAYEISISKGFDSIRIRFMLAISLFELRDFGAAARELLRAETMIEEAVAQGMRMNPLIYNAEYVRMKLDIANQNYEALLLSAKHFTAIADSDDNGDNENKVNAPIDASMRWLALRRYDEVARLMNEFIEISPDPENYAYAVFANEKIGNSEKTEQLRKDGRDFIKALLDDLPQFKEIPVWLAMFEAAVGENDQAIEYLQQAHAKGYIDHSFLIHMPIFDEIRGDARFVALLEDMLEDTDAMRARVDAARESGDWHSLIAKYFEDQATLDRRDQR